MTFRYEEAETPDAQAGRKLMADAKVLESVSQHVNDTLNLPHDVAVVGKACGDNDFWDPNTNEVLLCYEDIAHSEQRFANAGNPDAVQAAVDAKISAFYHELGHATLAIYDLAFTGREEDVADQARLRTVGPRRGQPALPQRCAHRDEHRAGLEAECQRSRRCQRIAVLGRTSDGHHPDVQLGVLDLRIGSDGQRRHCDFRGSAGGPGRQLRGRVQQHVQGLAPAARPPPEEARPTPSRSSHSIQATDGARSLTAHAQRFSSRYAGGSGRQLLRTPVRWAAHGGRPTRRRVLRRGP